MKNEQEQPNHLTTEQLLDFIEQRLAPDEVRSVQEHLATDCAVCSSELSWLQETLNLMTPGLLVDPPQKMRAAARQLYRDHQKEKQPSFSLAAWWRSLFAQPRPVAIAFAAAIALIIVGALVFQFWFNRFDAQEAKVAAVQGDVVALHVDSPEEQTVTDKTAFASGDQIRTGEDSSVVVTYPDNSITLVGSNSEVTILTLSANPDGTEQSVVLHQEIGRTHHVVQPLTSPQSRFEVHTPAAKISVRGTEFIVEVDSQGVTGVAVNQGTVEVEAQGTTVSLTTGEGTTVKPGDPPATPVPVPTITDTADLATPLSSRSKSEVDLPIGGDHKATSTPNADRDLETPTATSDIPNSATDTPEPSSTPKPEAISTSTATPSRTRESPTPTQTPTTEPPPTEPPTSEPPTEEPPTKEPPPPTEPPPPPTDPPPPPPPTDPPPPPPTEPPPPPPPTEPPPPPPPTTESYPPPEQDQAPPTSSPPDPYPSS